MFKWKHTIYIWTCLYTVRHGCIWTVTRVFVILPLYRVPQFSGAQTYFIVTTQFPTYHELHLVALCPLTCAVLRASFTVTAPGFAHCAAAHLLGEVSWQWVLTAPGLRHHQEAQSLLSWRLWQEKSGFYLGVIFLYRTDENPLLEWNVDVIQVNIQWKAERGENSKRSLTHQHIDFCPARNQPCRNIWSCPVC